MKSVVLAAALTVLSAPIAFAETAPVHAAPDATAGAPAGVPDEVKAFVKSNSGGAYPYSTPVRVGESVREMDAINAWRPVPNHPQYSWINLGGQLVVLDNSTKKVAAVY